MVHLYNGVLLSGEKINDIWWQMDGTRKIILSEVIQKDKHCITHS